MLRSERHGTRLLVFNEKESNTYTRMNRLENYYQLPYSKVTVSEIMCIQPER